jgi:hypothetical protein
MHVGKIKYRDQHRAEQARFAQHVQLRPIDIGKTRTLNTSKKHMRVRLSLFCFEFFLGRLRRLGAPP